MQGGGTIDKIFSTRPFAVTYVPVRDEPDFRILPTTSKVSGTYEIRPRMSLDPATAAVDTVAAARDRTTVVFLPGTRFDTFGTRHGRGGGWYDRFLAEVPASWARIGFCIPDQFSAEPLVRQSWDEPVDYVVVVGDDIAVHETSARGLVS